MPQHTTNSNITAFSAHTHTQAHKHNLNQAGKPAYQGFPQMFPTILEVDVSVFNINW